MVQTKQPKTANGQTKSVWVVTLHGGQYDDKWDHIEAVFMNRAEAEAYAEDGNKSLKEVDYGKYTEIEEYISEMEEQYLDKYLDEDGCPKGKSPEERKDYKEALDKFYHETQYELIKEKFGIDKDEYNKMKDIITYDVCFYWVTEQTLYL